MSEKGIPTAALARARRGAAFIDKQLGKRSWRRNVSRRALEMGHCRYCVVGQLFGDYAEGAEILGVDPYDESAQDYGFYDPLGRYSALTAAWKAVLREPAFHCGAQTASGCDTNGGGLCKQTEYLLR